MTTIGIIGAGHIGSQIARKAVENDYDVVISNSRGPETLAGLISELGPPARAATPEEAAAAGDFVLVAIPFGRYLEVPVMPLVGKVVIDANNYYPQRDGNFPELDDHSETSSGLLQKHLAGSHVVKAFNHIRAADITADARPAGAPDRRALAVAGNEPEARAFVTDLYDLFGFDAVDVGPISESWRYSTHQPAYVVAQNKQELVDNLAKATNTLTPDQLGGR